MRVGTKSVLFGAHQFLIHPWFVAAGWWKLYGFPWDPRLWAAFFVHDLGYLGKPNMDGSEGEAHVELGARIMGLLFGDGWANFARYHSRFYARRDGVPFSRLCVADKAAIYLTPAWLYLPMANWSGEISEYMQLAGTRYLIGEPYTKYETMQLRQAESQRVWFEGMTGYVRRWVKEHRDGRPDTWTPDTRKARDANGVYQ
jgi:hypothetical protein